MIHDWQELKGIRLSELTEGKIVEITIDERSFSILKKEGTVFAFAATCPHAGAKFCNGWLDAQGRVVCPEHKYRFDPKNGRNTSGEGYKLRTYPTAIREGIIFIGL